MNIRYLWNRFLLFRAKYFRTSSHWLVKKGSWWVHLFVMRILPYIVQAEIKQLRSLSCAIRQKDRYIAFLQNNLNGNGARIIQHAKTRNFRKIIVKRFIHFILFPFALTVFLTRKLIRFVLLRKCQLLIRPIKLEDGVKIHAVHEGNDRQIILTPQPGKNYPGGLVYFRYVLTGDGTPGPVLYIDPGTGFANEYTIPLPVTKNIPEEQLIELPPFTKAMKLEPGFNGVDYTLKDVALIETNIFLAAKNYARRRNKHYLRALYEIFIRRYPGVRLPAGQKSCYASWVEHFDILSDEDETAINLHMDAIKMQVSFSLVLDCSDISTVYLERTLISLRNQCYPNWELLLVDHKRMSPKILSVVAEYEKNDGRIRLISGAAGSSNDERYACIAAGGDYLLFVRPGSFLPKHALYMIAVEVHKHPGIKLLYTDHDYMDEYGRRYNPYFKPDWDYDLFLESNYVESPVFYSRDILRNIIDTFSDNDTVTPVDITCRFMEQIQETSIKHIPFILCHLPPAEERDDEMVNSKNGMFARIINDHLERTSQDASVLIQNTNHQLSRIRRNVNPAESPVSLLIPTRNSYSLLSSCIRGIQENTDYDNLEILIIDNESNDETTLNYLESVQSDPRVSVINYPGVFNFSAINNFAVEHAKNEYIGLLNNDVAVIERSWLREMMSHLVRPGVGVVGAKLLYSDETIQHGGVIVGLGGVAGHAFRYFPRNSAGVNNRLLMTQQLSCVTAACMLTKKSVYKDVGGLDDKNLKIAFNDVDYCLKVREKGLKIIWTPSAELYHLESGSRKSDRDADNLERWQSEYNFMKEKWGILLRRDPYYNPNLTLTEENFSLSANPRVVKPWRHYY